MKRTVHIAADFAPEIYFEIEPVMHERTVFLTELLDLPLDEQPIRSSVNAVVRQEDLFAAFSD